jgi:2'-5' RNA ligase
VEPGSVHVTLKFLGSVRIDAVEALQASLAEALKASGPFEVVVSGAGTFPGGRRAPRVVWLGLGEGTDRLAELARLVEGACLSFGFTEEGRPFKAHLTIGRVRRGSLNLDQLARMVEEVQFKPLKLPVSRVNLMRSELSPRGPTYTVLKRFALER